MDIKSMISSMQKNMKQVQQKENEKKLKARFVSETGGGIVKVVVNGNGEIISLSVSDSFKQESYEQSRDILSDLILSSCNNAKKQADEASINSESDVLKNLGNLGLPFKMDVKTMLGSVQSKLDGAQKEQREKKSKLSFVSETGGGIVKITVDGNAKIKSIFISDDLKAEYEDDDEEFRAILCDLIASGYNNAKKQADDANSDADSGLDLPFKMPF